MVVKPTAAVSSGACVTFDAEHVLNSSLLCAAVVDYPFYLPREWSLDNLNAEAIKRLGGADALNQSRAWYLLSNQCHASARQLACVETHSECFATGETTASATRMPCRSLCHVAHNTCGDTGRSVGYAAHNCSSSSFADVNCSLGSQVSVGEIVEAYTGSTCDGIASNVSIPNAMHVDASFAPLQPAGAVQSALEVAVTAVVEALPSWATRECQLAARIFMCASYLPLASKDPSPIVGAPRLASHETCAYYHQACAGALVRGEAYLDKRLFVDCSQRIGVAPFPGETYKGYPVFGNETVLDVGGVIGNVRTVPSFRVDSLELKRALASIVKSPTCTYGSGSYHIDGRSGRLQISGTACAIVCPAPYLTEREHLSRSGTELINSVVTLIVTFYSMLTYTWVRERRRSQPLFMVTFVLAFAKYVIWNFPKVVTLVIEGFKDWDFRTVGCYDRISPMLQSDTSICALQGLLYVAVSLAVSIAAAVIAFDVYVRTTFVPANPMKLVYRYYFPFLFISFPLLCVAPLIATKGSGYTFEKGFVPPANVCGASNSASLSYFLTMSFLVYVVMCIFICGGVRQLLKAVKRVKSMKSVRPVNRKSYENAQQTGVRRKKLVQTSMIDKKTLKFIQIPMIYLLARTFEILINYVYLRYSQMVLVPLGMRTE